jgi:WD40 repeat protein
MPHDPVFRVFVSSTFADFKHERHALQELVFPGLRNYCAARGAHFQAVDLRWGISEDAAADQQTAELCLRELARCRLATRRPNLIAFLGSRYGWRLLPSRIAATEFEALLEYLEPDARQLLVWTHQRTRTNGWYRLDENAVPAEYRLRPRRREPAGLAGAVRWPAIERRLRRLFASAIARAGWAADDPRRWKYEDSATHHELRYGALAPDTPDGAVHAYVRRFLRTPDGSNPRDRDFVDVEDPPLNEPPHIGGSHDRGTSLLDAEAQDRLVKLHEAMRVSLAASGRLYEYQISEPGALAKDELDPAAACEIAALCTRVEHDLRITIDAELSARPSAVASHAIESAAHNDFARTRELHFVGRTDALAAIRAYVTSAATSPLVVAGRSGSGKTALFAEAFRTLSADAGGQVFIRRFIGATPRSDRLTTLLQDLSEEISSTYGRETAAPIDPMRLRRHFLDAITTLPTRARPLILMLDGLDQLDAGDDASGLQWLPSTLPAVVHVVLSVQQREGDKGPVAAAEDLYRACKTRWPEHILELAAFSAAEGSDLLDRWLGDANRRLTSTQRQHILGNFAKSSLPLYLKLAFEQARHWSSWDAVPLTEDGGPVSSGRVHDVIADVFDRLEQPRQHGFFCSRTMAFLAASRHGLSEDELLDVLSADPRVMRDFVARSPTERVKPESKRLSRLPHIVWSRLYLDFEPFLTTRTANDAAVVSFFHRQIADVATERYADGDAGVRVHRALAAYFRGTADPSGDERWRGSGARGFANLPFHLARSRQRRRLNALLADFAWLQAKVDRVGINAALEDYEWMPIEATGRHIASALQLASETLAGDPRQLASQLYGRLMTLSDPGAAAFKNDVVNKAEHVWLRPWNCSLTPVGACVRTVETGVRTRRVAVAPDARRALIVTVDNMLAIVSLDRVGQMKWLDGKTPCSVADAAFSSDGQQVFCVCSDGSTYRWDAQTGRAESTIRAGAKHQSAAATIGRSGESVALAMADATIGVFRGAETQPVRQWQTGQGNIVAMAIADTAKRAISLGDDKVIKVWEVSAGRPTAPETNADAMKVSSYWPVESVDGLAISEDGRLAIAASTGAFPSYYRQSSGRSLRIAVLSVFNLEQGKQVRALVAHEDTAMADGDLTSDGRFAVTAALDGTVKLWDLHDEGPDLQLSTHSESAPHVAVSSDGRTVLSVADDGQLTIWDLRAGQSTPLRGYEQPAFDIVVGPKAQTALVVSLGFCQMWNLRTRLMGEILGSMPRSWAFEECREWIRTAAILEGEQEALVVSDTGAVTRWRIVDGKVIDTSATLPNLIAANLSRNGRWLAYVRSTFGEPKNEVTPDRIATVLHDLAGEHPDRVCYTRRQPLGLAVSNNGETVLMGGGEVVVWRPAEGSEPHSVANNYGSVAVSSDGRYGAFVVRRVLQVWDVEHRKPVASFTGDAGISSCALSDTGHIVAAGDCVGRVHILAVSVPQQSRD